MCKGPEAALCLVCWQQGAVCGEGKGRGLEGVVGQTPGGLVGWVEKAGFSFSATVSISAERPRRGQATDGSGVSRGRAPGVLKVDLTGFAGGQDVEKRKTGRRNRAARTNRPGRNRCRRQIRKGLGGRLGGSAG